MEVQKRKRYSKEFQEDVLNMLKTGDKTVMELSKELEISHHVIYGWYRKRRGSDSKDGERQSAEEKEVRELRRKLAEVTEERDILKKAVNIFSKQGTLK